MKNVDFAKPSQAKPSQAKPSQAVAGRPSIMSDKNKRSWLPLRMLYRWLVPEDSKLYKFLYFKRRALTESKARWERPERLMLNITTTNACNLNCKGCATFSPLVKEPYILDVSSYRKTLARLVELFAGDAEEIQVTGGEILLHPDVVDILSATREFFPEARVCFITNGTLLHKMDEKFWKCCHDNRVVIQITPYPIKLNYDRIKELMKQHDVEIVYFVAKAGYRERTTFTKLTLNPAGSCDINKSYELCGMYRCQTMRGDRIYRCGFSCFADVVNGYFGSKFETSEKDYVDIYEVKDKEEIFDFLAKPVPFCRYCDVDNWKFGIPWEVSKKEISEWI